jgi:hypothetical protein
MATITTTALTIYISADDARTLADALNLLEFKLASLGHEVAHSLKDAAAAGGSEITVDISCPATFNKRERVA